METVAHDLSSGKSRSNDVITDEDILFEELMLKEETIKGLENAGFKKPSPVQLENIPIGRLGLDLIIQSKAGTGKTCVFAVIALETLEFNSDSPVQCIIVVPTREIAAQIHQVFTSVGSGYKNLNCALCIGGTDVKLDKRRLGPNADEKCQIVVGTPGRIKQLIELNVLKTSHVELFVLDEADKLIEDQFKIQVDEIYKRLPADKQMIVTSATYPNELATFLRQYMQTPQNINPTVNPILAAVNEYYLQCKAGHSVLMKTCHKFESIKQLLTQLEFGQCVIFTNFQTRAPTIFQYLNKEKELVEKCGTVQYICAELPQDKRLKLFNEFKQSKFKVLVSTDVSARGIDIEGIDLVINFEIPWDGPTYYHRIGRAGRFGTPGNAVTLVALEIYEKKFFQKLREECPQSDFKLITAENCSQIVGLSRS